MGAKSGDDYYYFWITVVSVDPHIIPGLICTKSEIPRRPPRETVKPCIINVALMHSTGMGRFD